MEYPTVADLGGSTQESVPDQFAHGGLFFALSKEREGCEFCRDSKP